jgi:hypothetical protein
MRNRNQNSSGKSVARTIALCSLLAGALVTGQVAKAIDITLQNDGQSVGTGWYGPHENNETEPGTEQGQRWDLENIFLNGTALTIRGGFDFANGVNVGSRTIHRGDILIDLNGDAKYPWTSAMGPKNLNTTFKYDYAIRFNQTDTSNLRYQIVRLGSGSTFDVVTDVPASNPWRVSDNSLVYDPSSVGVAGLTSYTDGEGIHWDLTVDLGVGGYAALLGDMASSMNGALFHYSIECGNDVIVGKVPDGGMTLVLLGLSFGALVAWNRRQKIAAAQLS